MVGPGEQVVEVGDVVTFTLSGKKKSGTVDTINAKTGAATVRVKGTPSPVKVKLDELTLV